MKHKNFWQTMHITILLAVTWIYLALLATPLAAQTIPAVIDTLQPPPADLLQGLAQYGWFQTLITWAVPILAVLWILDVVVKLTPTKWDDFTVTFLRALFLKIKGLKR